MRIKAMITWEMVLHAWQKESNNCPRPNSDVWGILPGQGKDVAWFQCNLESTDQDSLFVIGSGDWKEVFGSYRASAVATSLSDVDDKHRHSSRIHGIAKRMKDGHRFYPPALVASSATGPFVAIDGNHRIIASIKAGIFDGLDVHVGFPLGDSYGIRVV